MTARAGPSRFVEVVRTRLARARRGVSGRPGLLTILGAGVLAIVLPATVVLVSFSLEWLLFGRDAAAAAAVPSGVNTPPLDAHADPRLCRLDGHAALLLTIACDDATLVAPLAGVQMAELPAAGGRIDTLLERLRSTGGSVSGGLTCSIVTASTDGQQFSFARCRVLGASLAELLVSATAARPAEAGSLSMRILPAAERQRLATLAAAISAAPRQRDPARLLQIQAWLATLYGLIGAAIGFVYKRGQDEVTAAKTRARLLEEVRTARGIVIIEWDALAAAAGNAAAGIESQCTAVSNAVAALDTALKLFQQNRHDAVPVHITSDLRAVRTAVDSCRQTRVLSRGPLESLLENVEKLLRHYAG